ncbi:MAG: hypothetical protein KJZ76_05380 [Burkholderiaceae bacterium]|nr:hypothetical protein [Burkholderiaceae bacterium]
MAHLPAWLLRAAAAVAVLCCGLAGAQDLRAPPAQTFTIWPNIPVVRATDLGDYTLDRQILTDLHTAKADPEKVITALNALGQLQAHHDSTALAQLGRTLNVQFIGEVDKQTRRINTPVPRLRFEFSGITPEELQRASALDAKGKEALQAKTRNVALAAYITYTRLQDSLVQATVTLVRLGSGASQSFTATTPVQELGEALGRAVFDYFNGTRFSSHQSPLGAVEWLQSAPGHADQLVSRDMALRYCQSQRAVLPTADELETAEAAGFYGGGVALRPYTPYHVQTGLYDATGAADDAGKVRPNHIASVRNGYYYCIRHPAPVLQAQRPRNQKR